MSKDRAVPDEVGHPNPKKDTYHKHKVRPDIFTPVTPPDAGPGRPQRYNLPPDPPPDDDAK